MFSWSNPRQRRPEPTYPAQRVTSTPVAQPIVGSIRPPEITRQQHIDSYLNDTILKRSTRKVLPDDSTYDTVFQTTAGQALILRVNMPPTSTSRVPAMTLVGVRATHPWLDARMKVIGYLPIQSDEVWQSARMLLGTAVHEVIQHLQLDPPNVLEITDVALQRLQANLGLASSSPPSTTPSQQPPTAQFRRNSAPPPARTDAPPDYNTLAHHKLPDMPPIPTNFDDVLGGMSRFELQVVLDDELEFLALLHTLPTFQKLSELGSNVLDENVKIAQTNLLEQARLEQLHQDVTSLQKSLKTKLESYETLEQLQSKFCEPPNPQQVLKSLQVAKKEALDESEAYAESWVDGDGSVDVSEFLRTFLEKRKLHHVRAAKVERMQATYRGCFL